MAKTLNISPSFTRNWNLPHLLLLALLAFICYWPLSFGIFSVKNDNILQFLPTRFHVSEALLNGHLPLWTPYMYLGYPLHGDMQGGAWNPFVWLISLFGRYNIYSLHAEIMIAIFLAGVSMYRLLAYFRADPIIKLTGAAAYMFCGYITDVAGSNLPFLWAASWIPLAMAYYLELLRNPSWKYAGAFALSFVLFLATAYPAFLILTAYVLFALLLIRILSVIHLKEKHRLISLGKFHLIALLIFVLMGAPVLLSYATILTHYARMSGVSLGEALQNSLHPACTVSLFFPPLTSKWTAVQSTDLISRNLYANIFLFFFFISTLLWWRAKLKWILLAGFLFFLLFSFGSYFPLRTWCYHIFPLMDTFRHPSNARLFVIIALITGGCLGWKMIPHHQVIPFLKWTTITASILCLLAIFYYFNKLELFEHWKDFATAADKRAAAKSFLDALTTFDLLWLTALLQLFFLLFFYISIRRKAKTMMVAWMIANSLFLAQTSMMYTMGSKLSPAIGNQLLNQYPAGYPLPGKETIAENSLTMLHHFDTIGFNGFYNKKIGLTNVQSTPTMMNGIVDLCRDSLMVATVLNNPVLFMPDRILSKAPGDAVSNTMVKDNGLTDPAIRSPGDSISIQSMWNNGFSIITRSSRPGYLVLQQLYLPGWKCTIDKEEVAIQKVNGSMMAVSLPAGKHSVRWIYQPSWLLISLILLITGTMILVYSFLKMKHVSI